MTRLRALPRAGVMVGLAALLVAATAGLARAHGWVGRVGGFGTATIDAVISPVEWDEAGGVAFEARLPDGSASPGALMIMNDGLNLYIAIRLARPRSAIDPADNRVVVSFYRDRSTTAGRLGDDVLFFSAATGFADAYRTPGGCPSGFCPTLDLDCTNGREDGAAAFSDLDGFFTYELRHPLKSGDAGHDFDLDPPSVIGIQVAIALGGAVTVVPEGTTPGELQIVGPVRVATSRTSGRPGDPLTIGVDVRNAPGNPPAELHVGLLFPDGHTLLSLDVTGALTDVASVATLSRLRPLSVLPSASRFVDPRLFATTIPPRTPPGTYHLFAALLRPGALADDRLDADEILGLDFAEITIAP